MAAVPNATRMTANALACERSLIARALVCTAAQQVTATADLYNTDLRPKEQQ